MKDNTSTRTRFFHIRLTPVEFSTLEEECKASTCRKLSEYARRKLFDKPIVATVRNRSIDEMMYELIKLRKDLNGSINNFNRLENCELRKVVADKIIEIKSLISQMGDKWLQ